MMKNSNFINPNGSFQAILVVGLAILLSAFTTLVGTRDTNFKPGEAGPENWKDYKSWLKITEEPNTGDPTGFLDKKHRGIAAFRDIYINEPGATTNTGEADFPYPEGTIIVKEAFKNEKSYAEQRKPELTIMVKLEEGSAPDTKDWEFIMGAEGKNRGAGMDTKWGKFCASCHLNAAATDYTFITHKFKK